MSDMSSYFGAPRMTTEEKKDYIDKVNDTLKERFVFIDSLNQEDLRIFSAILDSVIVAGENSVATFWSGAAKQKLIIGFDAPYWKPAEEAEVPAPEAADVVPSGGTYL